MEKDEDFLFPSLVKKVQQSLTRQLGISLEGPESCRHRKHRKILPPQYEKRFSHSSHPSRGLGSPGSETHEGSLQLHSQGYATLSHEKLGKISRVVFRASAQQHWKILSPQNTVRISSATHSSVGNHIRMFAAALIPTLEHGFSVAWFQIETKFYFGNHWMENRDFHVTIVQWKWEIFQEVVSETNKFRI